jgi:hypothetical protein
MQILILSKADSRPQLATTAFLASAGISETSITPTALSLFDLDDADCVIYIDQQPDFQIIGQLQQDNCPSILVADENCDDSHYPFIPFGILDRSNSVRFGIKTIKDYLDSIPLKANGTIFSTSSSRSIDDIDQSTDPNTHQCAPTNFINRQAMRDSNLFESLATG